MMRTPEDLFDRHAHALGDGKPAGLIRVPAAAP
jgi:hypothetical protein